MPMKVAIIGAGIAGTCAAWRLADRGHAVTVLDQFDVGHDWGSSHGHSRIIRKAYPDPFYTSIMAEGYAMWAELERRSKTRLVRECGLLYFGPASSASMKGVFESLSALEVPHEALDAARVGRVFPGFRLRDDEVAAFTPEAGWVSAYASVCASRKLAIDAGARFQTRRVESLGELERDFDAIIVCAGAWVRKFLDLDVFVTLQTYAYVDVERQGPVWIEDGPNLLYGFPSEPGRRAVKIGAHNVRTPFDPERTDRTPCARTLGLAAHFAASRFGEAGAAVIESATCLYALTDDEDFRIGRADETVLFASACSGHGFKFGPWLGALLADLAEGKADPASYPRFERRPRRFS